MQLNQLRYFISTVDNKSISNAAKCCFVSQPSLSQQIKKLEKSVGSDLFIRSKGSLFLTEEGEILYQEAKQILSLINIAKNKVKGCSANKSSRINIGVLPTMLPYVISNILSKIAQDNPKTKINLREADSKELSDSCLKHELDLIITAAPLQDERLTTHLLIEDPFFVALREDHHLAKQAKVKLSDLQKEPFILISNIHCLHDQISEFCKSANFSPSVIFETGQIDTIQRLISAGHGISILPSISKQNSMSEITYIPLKGEPSREIILAHRKDLNHSNTKNYLHSIIKK